jgi:hypothetical protein
MLEFLDDSGKLSERKARLFAVACCRRGWGCLADTRSRAAVEAVEESIEGAGSPLPSAEVWKAAESASREAYDLVYDLEHVPVAVRDEAALAAARRQFHAADMPFCLLQWTDGEWAGVGYKVPPAERHRRLAGAWEVARVAVTAFESPAAEARAQADLLRDIFGPLPYRPVTLSPSVRTWNDGCVVQLATGIYAERSLPEGTLDVRRLAILGDALEEAGVTDQEVLGHLRGPGPHCRGCWVVDLVLGKE